MQIDFGCSETICRYKVLHHIFPIQKRTQSQLQLRATVKREVPLEEYFFTRQVLFSKASKLQSNIPLDGSDALLELI